MNHTEQEAIAKNFKVLAGLRDLFQLLSEHGAVIGRDSARVVVDLNKAPSVKHREAILEGLFGGGDSPNWTYHDPEGRKLN